MASGTFGGAKRFDDVTVRREHRLRPAYYSTFTPVLHAPQGRAVSHVGTFSTARRDGGASLFNTKAVCTASYELPSTVGAESSTHHGVVRTEPRFTDHRDDSSPGPVYSTVKAGGTMSKQGPRLGPPPQHMTNHSTSSSLPESGFGRHVNQTTITWSRMTTMVPDEGHQRRRRPKCTFGVRHASLGSSPSDTKNLTPLKLPGFVDTIPSYKGVIQQGRKTSTLAGGEGGGADGPGPGAFSPCVTSGSPQWSFGRRCGGKNKHVTPGPGEYTIGKLGMQSSTLLVPTFNRVVDRRSYDTHGRDSPGPSVHSHVL